MTAATVNTATNAKIASLLGTLSSTDYTPRRTHADMATALACCNLMSGNSGWYKPQAIAVKGLPGMYMLNEDGNINLEFRFTQTLEGVLVEEITLEAYNKLDAAWVA